MKKTKINAEECYCAQDRLSELPDSLIFHIFSSLPTTDVVRTTLLSKRWVNLWTTITCLDFKDSTMRDRDKFRDFVNGALNSWRGAKISSFRVEFGGDLWNKVTHDDIDSWVLIATKKRVEKLKLYLPEPCNQISEYLVPDYLYSCSSLKNIWLTSCDLRIDGGNIMVKWDQLEFLMINGKCPSDDAINQVLCGSPKLEFLFLTLCSKSNRSLISIRSSSLKRLVISNSQLIDTDLRILTPNLQGFVIAGNPYSKFSMMNVSSLTEAYIYLFDPNHGRMVAQIFPPFQHVERTHLTDWCIKALGAMKEKSMPSPFPNANFLELAFFTQEYEEILGVLEMFPKLKDLVIRTNMKTPQPESEENRLKFDRNNFPDLFLMHLRTVDVTWTKGDDSIFPLIEFLLKYARNLEKMVIWENEPSKLLVKMERSSPTAEFMFDRAKLYL